MTAVLTTVGAALMATNFAANMSVPVTSVRVGSLAPAMRYDATPSPTGTRLQGLLDHTPRILALPNITLLSNMGVVQIDVSDEDLTAVYDADELAFMSGTTPIFLVAQASGPYYRKVAQAASLFSLNFTIAGMAATSVTISVPSFVFATQAQAEAGTAGNVMMSPLRTRQAIDEFAPTVDYQVFTASGTWTKPAGVKADSVVKVQGWGSGGAGSTTRNGGGGGYTEFTFPASALGATEAVVVGVEVAGLARASLTADVGNDSSFGTHFYARGAGRDVAGNRYRGFTPSGRAGGGRVASDDADVFSGGGNRNGGELDAMFGGGGGAATQAFGHGESVFGGNGGVWGGAIGGDGQPPGGGGAVGATRGGAGARGEVRVTTLF